MYKYIITIFTSGLVIMAVELTAVRIIAPIIGNSLYTWTSVIGIILLGLSLGNYAGGLAIDKRPEEKTLFIILFTAALLVATIPTAAKFVTPIIFWHTGLLQRIVLMALALFLLPSFALGAIYPASLRLFINRLDNAGRKAGFLSAISALGGIIGTFLTGFVLIGFLGSSLSVYLLSVFLMANSLLFKISKENLAVLTLIFFIFFLLFRLPSGHSDGALLETESNYYKIKMVDKNFNGHPARFIFLDFDPHSIESLDNQKLGTYQEISSLFQIFKKDFENILVIGGGSYNMPKDLQKLYKADVTVVEIDPTVTEMAKRFFNIDDYKIKTVNSDGRLYLNTAEEKFDLIVQDAFNSFISMPWHLATEEAFRSAKNRLNYGGIYALSVISSKEGDRSDMYKSVANTFAKVFPNYHALYLNSREEKLQNIFLIGVNSDENFNTEKINKKLSELIYENKIPLKISYAQKPVISEGSQYLSDDFAPMEKLALKSIDSYINDYAKWYYSYLK